VPATPPSGPSSSNTPASMWTQCETYMDECRIGTIVSVSGNLWRIDQRVNDRGIAIDLELAAEPFELFEELRELWPLVQPILQDGHVTKLTQGARFLQYLRTTTASRQRT
jgi:hypothetical protein